MAGEASKPQEQAKAQAGAGAPTAPASPAAVADAAQMAEAALNKAGAAAQSIHAQATAANSAPLDLPDFNPHANSSAVAQTGLSLLDDVTLNVKIELGRTRMYVEDVLRLNENSVVELDKAAGDPVDIYVNDRHVARGEVLVLNENFCVRVSEIIQQAELDD
jgi:flagellar motor switch protein FliN/FliY